MMIEAKNLGKRYSLKPPGSWAWPVSRSPELWALRGVSFSVAPGESIGIIGRNGSGKSTLLKLISRITHPTEGRLNLGATPTSLLELGAGFNNELTGRENIFLNGLVLGMSRIQILSHLDTIVDVADIGPFLNVPLKRYSSGMAMRLAFAIAAQVESELMIVDEVMAVGDLMFQKRSTEQLAKKTKQGTTVLFVSHNLGLINALCTRVIWLDHGRLIMDGSPATVTRAYLNAESDGESDVIISSDQSASDEFRFHRVSARRAGTQIKGLIDVHSQIEIRLEYESKRRIADLELSIEIFNETGMRICSLRRSHSRIRAIEPGRFEASVIIPAHFLVPGSYFIELVAHIPGVATLVQHQKTLRFEVVETGSTMSKYEQGSYGAVFVNSEWIEKFN